MYTAAVMFVTEEQRQILNEDGAPLPLIDADTGRCYLVVPVEIASDGRGTFRARLPAIGAAAEAEVPSDAVIALSILIRKMLEQ